MKALHRVLHSPLSKILMVFMGCCAVGLACAASEAYGYDALGRLKSVTYADGTVVYYDYDPAGNRTAVRPVAAGVVVDTITMVQGTMYGGNLVSSPPSWYGYYPGVISGASISPSALTGGKTIAWFVDQKRMGTTFLQTFFKVSGFTADPTAQWLTQVNCAGVARQASGASYSYASGTATWLWAAPAFTSLGFTGSGQISCSVTHK